MFPQDLLRQSLCVGWSSEKSDVVLLGSIVHKVEESEPWNYPVQLFDKPLESPLLLREKLKHPHHMLFLTIP